MSTRTIGVDLDGCLSNFVHGFVRYVHKTAMAVAPYPKWTECGYEPSAWDFPEMADRELFKRCISTFHEQPNFWQNLSAYPANCDALGEFLAQRKDINVIYLTARPSPTTGPSALVQTNRWLRVQNLLADNTTVVVVPSWEDKVEVALRVRAGYVIDDHPQTISRFLFHALDARLLTRPWNQDADLPRCATLKNWLDSIK